MKDFFKNVLATIVGLILFMLIFVALGLMSLMGIVASGSAKQNVSDNTVLVLNLSAVDEKSQPDIMSLLSNRGQGSTGLNDIVSALKKAKDNDRIKGVYFEASGIGTSFASLQEIRRALVDFRKSGKWVVAYGDTYTQSDYYLASAANTVYMNPQGMLDWHGLAVQPMFLKDAFAKIGVKYQVVKVGTFKSATEAYTEEKMSDANREQYTVFLNGTWNNICKDVAASRKVSIDQLNLYADSLVAFAPAEDQVKNKLVDKLIYANEVKGEIKKLLKLDEDDDINQISVEGMKNVKGEKRQGDEIAVYYAYGGIVDEASGSPLSQGSHNIVGSEMVKDLEQLMNDDDVKAVVIRVNSPGGSAYASEQIWHQIVQLKEKKPVVVSMGDYAASGGYYISCPASWIVAESNTLTGSIGIFGLLPDMSELATKKLGLRFDEVKTNRNSTFGSNMARPCSTEEIGILQGYVNRGYQLFRKRVADGRKQPVEEIEKIAQGRVWLGQDALKLKLVDQLGGIDEAVKKAAQLAKLDKYHTKEYPAEQSWDELFLNTTSNSNYLDGQIRAMLGDFYEPFYLLKTADSQNFLQARLPFFFKMR